MYVYNINCLPPFINNFDKFGIPLLSIRLPPGKRNAGI